jgi:hypothetical protein
VSDRPSRAEADRELFLDTVLNLIMDSRLSSSKAWYPLMRANEGSALTQDQLSDVLEQLQFARDKLTVAISEVQTVVAIGE